MLGFSDTHSFICTNMTFCSFTATISGALQLLIFIELITQTLIQNSDKAY